MPTAAFGTDLEPLNHAVTKELHVASFADSLACTSASDASTLPPATQTLSAHEVHFEALSQLQELMANANTCEGLDDLLGHLNQIRVSHLAFMASYNTDTLLHRSQYQQEAHQDGIHDPPIMKSKGRPRMTCLNSRLEGPPQGGGGTQYGVATRVDHGICDGGRKCAICQKLGHN